MGAEAAPRDFADAFDRALTASGMGVSTLRARLASRGVRVASSTLGYWRGGQRQPERPESLEAIEEIEALLQLPAGALLDTLVDSIPDSRRAGAPFTRADVDDLPGMAPGMAPGMPEALARLNLTEPLPGHIEETLDLTADIDADGQWRRMISRARLRAGSHGVTRSTGYCITEPGQTALNLEVRGGATLGRVVRVEEAGILLAELLLERPLSVGQTALVEYSFAFGPGQEVECELSAHAANRMDDISVWARFDPISTPRRAWRREHPAGGPENSTEIPLGTASSIHHQLPGFGPGLMGVCWEW